MLNALTRRWTKKVKKKRVTKKQTISKLQQRNTLLQVMFAKYFWLCNYSSVMVMVMVRVRVRVMIRLRRLGLRDH